MRELTRHDTGKAVLFLDAFTFVPGIGPSSDMDGHDLSGLTYSEEAICDDWVEAFNDHYLDKAFETNYMGVPLITVKDFYDDSVFGYEDDDEANLPEDEKESVYNAVVDSWMLFDLTPAEEQKFKVELKKRLGLE